MIQGRRKHRGAEGKLIKQNSIIGQIMVNQSITLGEKGVENESTHEPEGDCLKARSREVEFS